MVLGADGEPVTDPETVARVAALGIPPAWTDVWIAASPNAHLQATGRDAKGRRQYVYHPAWRERRDEEKFDDMLDFAGGLPAVRATAERLLAQDGLRRDRMLALAVRLLDVGMFRVGWDRYARDNGHVGLTTLRRDQATVDNAAVRFDFVGKAGKRRRMTVRDPEAVAALGPLRRRRSGPEELLVYRAGGAWHRLHAPDVNNALRAWAAGPYAAKEFRTWSATVLAAVAVAREEASGKRSAQAVHRAVREVSTALGNTPVIARKSYIDPRVISAYEDGTVVELPPDAPEATVPLHIEAGADGVVVELPADRHGDEARLEIERRVRDLLTAMPEGR